MKCCSAGAAGRPKKSPTRSLGGVGHRRMEDQTQNVEQVRLAIVILAE
jgi:hypothetical protein